jgi:hypothetical protein
MESLIANSIADLHAVNARLTALLVRMHPDRIENARITAEGLSGLLSELAEGAALVKALVDRLPADREAQREVAQYRDHLLHLHEALPAVQTRLLTERSRLEAQRTHLQAASAWADVAQKLT